MKSCHKLSVAASFILLAVVRPAFSQDIPAAPTANNMMRYYFAEHDIVATGSFVRIIDENFAVPILIDHDVEAIFSIQTSYKNPEPGRVEEVSVVVPTDMLIYPGEQISRYRKRRAFLDSLTVQVSELTATIKNLEQEYSTGKIDEEQYTSQAGNLDKQLEDLIHSSTSVTPGSVVLIGSESFYDLDGAITTDEVYLLFADKEGDSYRLDPAGSGSYIYWGQLMNELIPLLEAEIANSAP